MLIVRQSACNRDDSICVVFTELVVSPNLIVLSTRPGRRQLLQGICQPPAERLLGLQQFASVACSSASSNADTVASSQCT